MKHFSDFALEKQLDLYVHLTHEVGSELRKTDPEKYKSLTPTDCITYALNVIGYAFKKSGDPQAAKAVWRLGKHGTELAVYLVKHHNWNGIGDSRPRHADIKVVVYRHTDLQRVQQSFHTDPARERDYRYVDSADAFRYLNRMIADNAIESLTQRLTMTRQQIIDTLGAP
jgi:hypothetical protein